MIRLLIEFGVQRDDAAVGIFELAIEPCEFLLLPLQFIERAEKFLVLQLDLLDQPVRTPLTNTLENLVDAPLRDERNRRWKEFLEAHACAGPV